MINVN